MPGQVFVDQVQLAVAAGAEQLAGVVDLVTHGEAADGAAHGADHAGDVPAQHLGLALHQALAHLGVDRIDRHGADFHQEIMGLGRGVGQHRVLQGTGIAGGQGGVTVDDGFHGRVPLYDKKT